MTATDHKLGSPGPDGWFAYGNHITLLVQGEIAGTPMAKLMDVGQFATLIEETGSIPEVWAVGDGGYLHRCRHHIAGGAIAFHFPTGSQNDFGIDVPPTFAPPAAQRNAVRVPTFADEKGSVGKIASAVNLAAALAAGPTTP